MGVIFLEYSYLSVLLLATAVSMDAFSVSLTIGMGTRRLRNMMFFILFVGIFHIMMPLVGMIIGHYFSMQIGAISKIFAGAILIIIGIQMIAANLIPQVERRTDHFIQLAALAFTVSLDSFSVGITLGFMRESVIVTMLSFGIMSMAMTTLGMYVGSKGKFMFGTYSESVGGLVLCLLGVFTIW
ncbi:manganese efflux pump MntP family protein [Halalkalibacillus halophilus]|uniref:manganese efflux pump MntP n=1 Tax=Halalkalibacillus halophilus TaxID=392827 RepID=UPI000684FDA3|nr:manganese efflux pump [Halalkalibacillus halophilus]